MSPSLHSEAQEVQQAQEAEIANYGGWQEQQSSPSQQQATSAQAGLLPLLDEADHVNPDQIQQDRPWWMRPTPRMIVAGGAVMVLVWVLFSWFGLWGSNKTDKPTSSFMPTDTVALNQEVDTRIKQLQAENENLKRDQVMGEPLAPPNPSSQQTKPVSVPPSPTTVNTPAPRIVYVTQPAASRTIPYTPPPLAQPAPAIPRQSAPVKTELEADPMKQWQMAANAGSFGGDSSNRDGTQTAHAQAADNSQGTVSNPTNMQTRVSLGTPLTQTSLRSQTSQSQTLQSQVPSTESNYQLNNYPSDSSARLMVGTRAAGEIDVPISWSGNSSQSASLPNLRIKLLESLKTAEGREVIPAGSFLIVHVDGADSAGFLLLSAVSVQSRFSGNESRLPEGAIRIFDRSGNPLKANYHGAKGRSFLSHVTDAAAIAGGVTRNSSLYMLNGLQGSSRDFQTQPTYFSLERRTRVELYVNQSFSPAGVP